MFSPERVSSNGFPHVFEPAGVDVEVRVAGVLTGRHVRGDLAVAQIRDQRLVGLPRLLGVVEVQRRPRGVPAHEVEVGDADLCRSAQLGVDRSRSCGGADDEHDRHAESGDEAQPPAGFVPALIHRQGLKSALSGKRVVAHLRPDAHVTPFWTEAV
jgi:hypothetical protein